MPRRPYDRSSDFGARFAKLLERSGVPRQRVARHLEKAYTGPQSPDFRAWEGRLMRYAAGMVPKPHELEAVLRGIVWPLERLPEVGRWLLEGGAEPEFAVTLGDRSPATRPVPIAPLATSRAAEPFSSD